MGSHIEAIAEADIARFGTLGVIASQQPMRALRVELREARRRREGDRRGPEPDS